MTKKPSVPARVKRSAAVPQRPRQRKAQPKARVPVDGAAEVREYIKALPASEREMAERFDTLVEKLVPGVVRILKWKIPFYGVSGNGWFVSCMGRDGGVRVTFYQGIVLKPNPPLGGKQVRGIDLRQAKELDSATMSSWIRQASKLPGFASESHDRPSRPQQATTARNSKSRT